MHIVSLLPAEALAISGRWGSLCGMTLVCIHLEFVINLNTFPDGWRILTHIGLFSANYRAPPEKLFTHGVAYRTRRSYGYGTPENSILDPRVNHGP